MPDPIPFPPSLNFLIYLRDRNGHQNLSRFKIPLILDASRVEFQGKTIFTITEANLFNRYTCQPDCDRDHETVDDDQLPLNTNIPIFDLSRQQSDTPFPLTVSISLFIPCPLYSFVLCIEWMYSFTNISCWCSSFY